MKLRFALLFIIAFSPVFSFAQGCLTVFSEDGDRFFLVLNGIKQNPVAQTNVRIDGLTNEFYSAKIIFEAPGKPEITKSIPVKDPGTSQWAEVTYKIKTKDGQPKLRYFGATPVPVNYNPPPDVYVMHYGQPAPPANTVTQTTVTTTATHPGDGGGTISISGGMGGVNMNVNISDPTLNGGVTQTTTTTRTTTTSTSTNYDNGGYNNAPPPPTPARCQYPMDRNSFMSAKQTVEKASFDETKLSTAKTIVGNNCVSTDQVIALCNLFSFEASKLDFAKFAYSKTTDPGNYFKVGNIFSFDASKTELNNFISGN